jgi:hypothetical protein
MCGARDNVPKRGRFIMLSTDSSAAAWAQEMQCVHFGAQYLHLSYKPNSLIRYWRVRREMPRI